MCVKIACPSGCDIFDSYLIELCFTDMSSAEKQLLGTETVRALRSKGVSSLLCGLSANDLEGAFLNAGADGFMIKPFPCKTDELQGALTNLIRKRPEALSAEKASNVDAPTADDTSSHPVDGHTTGTSLASSLPLFAI